MCLTIPAKVVSIKKSPRQSLVEHLEVEDSKGTREIKSIIDEELKIGDWVLYTLDMAVRKVSEEDAREILELLEPKSHIDFSVLDSGYLGILKKASTGDMKRREIIRLLESDGMETEALLAEANTIRQANLKDFFCIHGIIEFSNNCINDCHYCGLRRSSTSVKRYAMTPDEIIETAVDSVEKRGYKLIVLQSGDDYSYTKETLSRIISEIKRRCRVFIFMSVGDRSYDCYRLMREAGANGALLRFETSNAGVYEKLHPGKTLEERMEILKGLKDLGYYIASGFLIGLPGQESGDIADDMIALKNLGAQMVTVGPFIPCDGTPLSSHPSGDAAMTLKVTAIARLLMPKAKIPVTTALETIESEEGRRLGLSSGANSLMFNLTPQKYRDDYRIYPGKYHGREEVWERYGLFKEELSYKMLETKMLQAFEET